MPSGLRDGIAGTGLATRKATGNSSQSRNVRLPAMLRLMFHIQFKIPKVPLAGERNATILSPWRGGGRQEPSQQGARKAEEIRPTAVSTAAPDTHFQHYGAGLVSLLLASRADPADTVCRQKATKANSTELLPARPQRLL